MYVSFTVNSQSYSQSIVVTLLLPYIADTVVLHIPNISLGSKLNTQRLSYFRVKNQTFAIKKLIGKNKDELR